MRVEDLEAGYKLNRLVATEVMGWYEVPQRIINGRDLGKGLWHNDMGDPLSPRPRANCLGLPGYCYDMSSASAVMNKLGIALIPQSTEDGSYNWLAADPTVVSYAEGITIFEKEDCFFSSSSAPHAICICALLSKGIFEVH